MPASPKTAPNLNKLLQQKNIRALIFDLDGVVTQTAKLHAAAWKKMFDEFLQNGIENGPKSQPPFSIQTDYPRYLDGISRLDGIRNFLLARNLELPPGQPEDTFEKRSVWGLANYKNELYQQLLQTQGVAIYPDTITWIKQKRAENFRTAIISASKNCLQVLQAAQIENLFDVRIDGNISQERNLKSKPEPDIFLEAARELNISPTNCAVFEDARAGVQAGKAGNFGLVVGVNRKDASEAKALLESGGGLVITQFPGSQ
ncbi:beta-phosphoglucomutase family hydrolase [Adhaeribacter sp. BT258]|uniref:Beta-phosphoglucomutase n=1 Tax=Adhaeribacter terrigena TaxID=2793070 RepID=A0ABS1C214_9BACT|nr:beta-phosphoglucomutase family hydrolase [Adhaeribacter terrigena]MBK0403358.1 beta-phosphoglucomutase family hydrolase [Adhaeribacter terrigena]